MSATWSLVVIWQKPGIRKFEFVSLCKNVMVNFNGMNVALWRFKTTQLESSQSAQVRRHKATQMKASSSCIQRGMWPPPLQHLSPSYIISLNSIGCLCTSLCSAAWHPTGLLRENGMLRFQDQARDVLAWGLESTGKTRAKSVWVLIRRIKLKEVEWTVPFCKYHRVLLVCPSASIKPFFVIQAICCNWVCWTHVCDAAVVGSTAGSGQTLIWI